MCHVCVVAEGVPLYHMGGQRVYHMGVVEGVQLYHMGMVEGVPHGGGRGCTAVPHGGGRGCTAVPHGGAMVIDSVQLYIYIPHGVCVVICFLHSHCCSYLHSFSLIKQPHKSGNGRMDSGMFQLKSSLHALLKPLTVFAITSPAMLPLLFRHQSPSIVLGGRKRMRFLHAFHVA